MGKFGPFLRCGAASRAIPKVRTNLGRGCRSVGRSPRVVVPAPAPLLTMPVPASPPAWRSPTFLPPAPQGYDPLTLTLADALQLLATKVRWATSKKERKAAADAAAAAAQPGMPFGAAALAAGGALRRGRPSSKAAKAAELAGLGAEAAAEAMAQVPEHDSRRRAAIADVEARLALDAAANIEIESLKDVLGYTAADAAPLEAALARVRKAQAIHGYQLFFKGAQDEGRGGGSTWGGVCLWCICSRTCPRPMAGKLSWPASGAPAASPPCRRLEHPSTCRHTPGTACVQRRRGSSGTRRGSTRGWAARARRLAPCGPRCLRRSGPPTTSRRKCSGAPAALRQGCLVFQGAV